MDADSVNPNVAPEAPKPSEGSPLVSGEQAPHATPERTPASPERSSTPSQGMSLPPVQPPAAVQATPAPLSTATDDDGTTPAIADDVDVIEMEWVNQAKKVIKDNKDNPHAQEVAVEKLQRDYLKKRYGRELKTSSG